MQDHKDLIKLRIEHEDSLAEAEKICRDAGLVDQYSTYEAGYPIYGWADKSTFDTLENQPQFHIVICDAQAPQGLEEDNSVDGQ